MKRIYLDDLFARLPRQECRTCDCLQGFLTQIELDTDKKTARLIDSFKVDRERMHGCLGCDPCPPAEAFSKYMREQQENGQ